MLVQIVQIWSKKLVQEAGPYWSIALSLKDLGRLVCALSLYDGCALPLVGLARRTSVGVFASSTAGFAEPMLEESILNKKRLQH